MRNESTVSSFDTAARLHPSARSTKSSSKPDSAHEHENVQRFRKLMDGKNSGKADAADGDASDTERLGDAAGEFGRKLSQQQDQALRELLQRQLDAAADGKAAIFARDDSEGDAQSGGDSHDESPNANIGSQMIQQATQLTQSAVQQPTVAAQSAFTPALAELIERHVKQLLVPDATSRSSTQSREIMITLKDGLLPDTELWLSRTGNGWRLRADTRSPDAYRSLTEGASQLIERFASSHLGELEIDPALLG